NKALQSFKKALGINPLAPLTNYAVGDTLIALGELEESFKQYQYCHKLLPEYLATPIVDINNWCQLVGSEVSYTVNLIYTELDLNNCKSLSTATQFFYIDPPDFLIVTDSAGLVIEMNVVEWRDEILEEDQKPT
ncbi:MAG: hypothetical protein GY781_04225, partial [Gammaproteobacteria bacterium]|nr:hypothetical protein [Gammaproteobacteria bacterium]